MKRFLTYMVWLMSALVILAALKHSKAVAVEQALANVGAEYIYTTNKDWGLKEYLTGEAKVVTTKGPGLWTSDHRCVYAGPD
jgi:hypothetical protein